MICPYLMKNVITQKINPVEFIANDGQSHVCWEVSEISLPIPTECLQEGCAAWSKDECKYKENIKAEEEA